MLKFVIELQIDKRYSIEKIYYFINVNVFNFVVVDVNKEENIINISDL